MDRFALRWVGYSCVITMVNLVQAFLVLARLRSENAASAICVSDFTNFKMDRFALRRVRYSRVITMVLLVRAFLVLANLQSENATSAICVPDSQIPEWIALLCAGSAVAL